MVAEHEHAAITQRSKTYTCWLGMCRDASLAFAGTDSGSVKLSMATQEVQVRQVISFCFVHGDGTTKGHARTEMVSLTGPLVINEGLKSLSQF